MEARNPAVISAIAPVFAWLSKHYFHLQVEGAAHLRTPQALIVANHNGGIIGPDVVCTLSTLWHTLGAEAPLYAMAHDFAMRQLPGVGKLLGLGGGLRAHPDNARAVLKAGGSCLVYPGGDIDAYRPFTRRNEVLLGKRTGFVRIAQEIHSAIVPLVAAGAHCSAIILTEGKGIARALRMKSWARLERFPIALGLPWGLALGPWLPYMPLPFPIRLRALAPIHVAPEDDPAEVREHVREQMQSALTEMTCG